MAGGSTHTSLSPSARMHLSADGAVMPLLLPWFRPQFIKNLAKTAGIGIGIEIAIEIRFETGLGLEQIR